MATDAGQKKEKNGFPPAAPGPEKPQRGDRHLPGRAGTAAAEGNRTDPGGALRTHGPGAPEGGNP